MSAVPAPNPHNQRNQNQIPAAEYYISHNNTLYRLTGNHPKSLATLYLQARQNAEESQGCSCKLSWAAVIGTICTISSAASGSVSVPCICCNTCLFGSSCQAWTEEKKWVDQTNRIARTFRMVVAQAVLTRNGELEPVNAIPLGNNHNLLYIEQIPPSRFCGNG